MQGSEANGLSVGRADRDGVYVDSAGDMGVLVESAGLEGVRVNSADRDGLMSVAADRYGILVVDADADGDGNGGAGYFEGDVIVTGNVSKSGGGFTIDHPLDPENETLTHSFVEAPERMNVYNGNVTTDDDGYATVTLPDYFEALNRDYRYQLTVIGDTFAQAIVAQEVENNQFVIRTDEPNVKVSWQVTGVRQDAWAEANPLEVEAEKPAEQQGLYRNPEAHGEPASKSIAPERAERTETPATEEENR